MPSDATARRDSDDAVLVVDSLGVRFGGLRALQGVSLTVRRGETLAVMGASGCGKSTLLRCLIGAHRPDGGTVRLFGKDIWALQAKELDAEIARGRHRGPLHGIPWGAKDLLAVKGYPTTWGAGLYENQTFDFDATVVKRLDDAGAILIAKLTLGALAQGNRWWKERTRNPWWPENLSPGSSGSSAGPASATAAGCVGFSIGSETNGSISAICTRSGRPATRRGP